MNRKAVSFILLCIQATSVTPSAALAGGLFNPEVNQVNNASVNMLSSMASGSPRGGRRFSDGLADQAAGAASGLFGDQLSSWLRQSGTARVNLNVDRHGDWDASSVDWLFPLWQSPQDILFTQLGFRNPDGRRTLNAGFGVRTSINNWMYGANVFVDNDFTGHNRRVGIGAEAWHDYLKLSTNTYFGMTAWHQSRDFDDYDERPADGWDIRTQTWAPALPQLGGQLIYEKYHGKSVALVDKEVRRRNPSAVTAGLNYTPVPLVSLGVEQRMAAGGHDDTQFSVKFRYQFGTPLQTQISPDAVSALRTLAGSRFDLVERNNAIVLDYRKQDLISLSLPENLEGEGGADISITAQVTSKYALSSLDWRVSSVTSAGGKISSKGIRDIRLTLPAWQARGLNQYRISAVARDARGNRSGTASTVITVSKPSARLADGSVTVVRNNADADGTAINEVQAKVTDTNGWPVRGQAVSFTATNGAMVTHVTGKTGPDGNVRAALTSLTAGESVVTASLLSGQSASATVIFRDAARIAAGDLTVTQNNAAADGVRKNTVQARVTNAAGKPLSGQKVSFTATNGVVVTVLTGTTGADGLTRANLTSTTAGRSVLTATLSNGKSASATATFVALSDIAIRDVTILRNNAVADGSDTDQVRFRVTDGSGMALSGQQVSFVATDGAVLSASTARTASDGTVTVTLTSRRQGRPVITASLSDGKSAMTTVTFITAAKIETGSFVVTANNAVADGTATNAVRLKVVNGSGVAVSGQQVTFTATNGATVTTSVAKTGTDGVAGTTLTSAAKGDYLVTATLSDGTSATVTVTFIVPAKIQPGSFVVTANNATADGVATNAVQLKVVNGSGVAVSGQQVIFTATKGSRITTTTVTTGNDGMAGTTLTSTASGDSVVTASLAGTRETASVSVTFAPSYSDFAGIKANGQTFAISAGFPESGFNGASFTLMLPGNASAEDYVWTTSASWVSAYAETGKSAGTVRFSGTGTGSAVTVTARPSSGAGQAYRYMINLKKWFIFGSVEQSRAANTAYCTAAGYGIPSYADMTNAPVSRKNGTRAVGPLWSEWGSLVSYPTGIRVNYTYMSSDYDNAIQYSVRLATGWIYDTAPAVTTTAACMNKL